MYKFQVFLFPETFDIAVHIWKRYFSSHNESHCQIGPRVRIALYQLIFLIIDIMKDLIQFPGLESRIGKRVERSDRRDKKVQIWVRY